MTTFPHFHRNLKETIPFVCAIKSEAPEECSRGLVSSVCDGSPDKDKSDISQLISSFQTNVPSTVGSLCAKRSVSWRALTLATGIPSPALQMSGSERPNVMVIAEG